MEGLWVRLSRQPIFQIAAKRNAERRKGDQNYLDWLQTLAKAGEDMTAKDYLSQAYRIDQRINSKIEQVQSLRDISTKVSATLTHAPPSGSRNVHRMEDVIVKMVDLEDDINKDLNRLIDLKREIVTVIKCVESLELQTLLEQRYLCFRTWEQIAVELNYNLRWIHRLHKKALDEVEIIRRT